MKLSAQVCMLTARTSCAQISKLNEEKQALEDRCDELEGALKKRDEETRALRREVEALRRGGDAGEAPHTVRACCRLPALPKEREVSNTTYHDHSQACEAAQCADVEPGWLARDLPGQGI